MNHNIFSIKLILTAIIAMVAMSACNDDQSYADRLNVERNAVNAYLADHKVVMSVPDDTVFEVGPDAPFYRIDPDGNVYMQVLNAGDRVGDKAKTGEPIYFRFARYNLAIWYSSGTWAASADSNENSMSASSCSFNYADYTLPSSSQWGYGLQFPLAFLGVECEVNLIVKSQYGYTTEISYVQPYMFHIRYFHSMI